MTNIIKRIIKAKTEKDFLLNWDNSHRDKIVMTGLIMDVPSLSSLRLGSVCQVRIGAGLFGTDIVFLKHLNGDLVPHENQYFFNIPEELREEVEEMFASIPKLSGDNVSFTIQGERKETGFIIEKS